MSLVFAPITPHTPLLIPSIGKKKTDKVKKTKESLLQLEQDLYVSKPQIIMMISPHTGLFESSFSVNAHTAFESCFDQFGDLATKRAWNGATDLAAKIAHMSNSGDVPVRLVSEDKVDHGVCVPLFFLTAHLPDVKILPIGYSNLDAKEHMKFGELLKDVIMETDKRVAVIASGDLSHCLETESPGGFHKDGKVFDETFTQLLETRNTLGIAQMDEGVVKNAQQCAYRSVLILLGILKNMDYTFKNYSYEAPFGVGYLVGNFVF